MVIGWLSHEPNKKLIKTFSHTGTRTRVFRGLCIRKEVKAGYPNQLDYMGLIFQFTTNYFEQKSQIKFSDKSIGGENKNRSNHTTTIDSPAVMTPPSPSPPLPTSDPSPINVYDFASVRQKIDKNIRDILVNEQGYQEDFTTNNIKILLGIIACTSAVVAYFKSDPSLVLILCLV